MSAFYATSDGIFKELTEDTDWKTIERVIIYGENVSLTSKMNQYGLNYSRSFYVNREDAEYVYYFSKKLIVLKPRLNHR